jgi:ribose transport system ATP-binding protein
VIVMSEGRVTGELAADEATQERVMHLATLRPDEPADVSPEPPSPEPAAAATAHEAGDR